MNYTYHAYSYITMFCISLICQVKEHGNVGLMSFMFSVHQSYIRKYTTKHPKALLIIYVNSNNTKI